MAKAWKEWEGQVLGEFRLGEYLGGSERAGVFLTTYGPESRKAAIKLIPIGTWDPAAIEAELSRLNAARDLSHPHLLQIFQAGRAKGEDTELLFVVLEYAEEDLSQILPVRALEAEEVREMLKPTLEALRYLHEKGWVHGHLKPANVMAIGDQVKLSSDGIWRAGEPLGGEGSDYDAPEIAKGEISATSDIWSLGLLLAVALTQRLPGWDASGEDPVFAENAPPPFGDIARHCLRRDARARWCLGDIAGRMGFESAAESKSKRVAKRDLRASRTASRAAATPQSAAPQQKAISGAGNVADKPGANAWGYVAGGVVLVIAAILIGPRLYRSGTVGSGTVGSQKRNSQTSGFQGDSQASDSQTSSGQRNSKAPGRPAGAQAKSAPANSGIAKAGNPGAGGEALRNANSTELGAKEDDLLATPGQVAQQILPDVPQSARDTIHGTVRVGVRIGVDSAGNVTQAELDSAGPSKYFAQLALDAAQQWKFEPPRVEGRNVLSDWLLQFQFTALGTKVIPMQTDP